MATALFFALTLLPATFSASTIVAGCSEGKGKALSVIVKLIPGLIAAIVAFVALRIIAMFRFDSLAVDAIVFFGIYLITAYLADRAMAAYGRPAA
jgi:hypothetical protein